MFADKLFSEEEMSKEDEKEKMIPEEKKEAKKDQEYYSDLRNRTNDNSEKDYSEGYFSELGRPGESHNPEEKRAETNLFGEEFEDENF